MAGCGFAGAGIERKNGIPSFFPAESERQAYHCRQGRSGIDCVDWGVPLRPRFIRTYEIDVAAMPDTGSGGGIP